jgi:hypothetical protein
MCSDTLFKILNLIRFETVFGLIPTKQTFWLFVFNTTPGTQTCLIMLNSLPTYCCILVAQPEKWKILWARWFCYSTFSTIVYQHPFAVLYLFVYTYFHLKWNLLSSPSFLSLHVLAEHGYHQMYVYLGKTVPLYDKLHIRCECNVGY